MNPKARRILAEFCDRHLHERPLVSVRAEAVPLLRSTVPSVRLVPRLVSLQAAFPPRSRLESHFPRPEVPVQVLWEVQRAVSAAASGQVLVSSLDYSLFFLLPVGINQKR